VAGRTRMTHDADFSVLRRLEDGVSVVVPAGEIDLATVDAVRIELGAARRDAPVVVLDLRAVTFMDSAGLRLLVETQRAADEDGFSLLVTRGSANVERVVELVALAGRLTFIADPSEARHRGRGAR